MGGHTYSNCFFHIVFSTKERRSFALEKMRHLHRYLVGIAKTNGFQVMLAGGAMDHVHLLVILPTSIDVAKAVRLMKSGSSEWFNEEYKGERFAWQSGFAVFTASQSQVRLVLRYIEGQEEHHKKKDFATEFISFLERNGIEYDPKYVLG